MTRDKERPVFASEAELCATFSAEMVRQGWTVYPETDGWDVLLVGHGLQVGVEAKLRPSMGVLAQLSTRLDGRDRGPDHAIVLVPYATPDFEVLAVVLGAQVYMPRLDAPRRIDRRLDIEGTQRTIVWRSLVTDLQYAQPLHFDTPAWTPPVDPGGVGGCSAPVRLTPWKVSALRLIARLELRGWVTVHDFREVGLHPSRWYNFWLEPRRREPLSHKGTVRQWVRKPGVVLADEQHPEAYVTMRERERSILAAKPEEAALVHAQALPLLDAAGI